MEHLALKIARMAQYLQLYYRKTMIKKLFLITLLITSINAKDCSPYFNPDKFYEAPEYLQELIENNIDSLGVKLFDTKEEYSKLNFKKSQNEYIKEKSFLQFKDYKYPLKTQLWKYKLLNNQVDEINISKTEYYRFADLEIANEINENFEQFWSDWIEDGYSMQLVPEQILFRYKDSYFSFSVFIYGIKNDATPLEKTVINYWLKNYTPQVNEYIECSK